MKSVFVIPSWYPSESDPITGIFIRNQVESIRLHTDYNPIVALWGQNDENVPLNRPGKLLPWLKNYRKQENSSAFIVRDVEYIFHKVFSWSHRLPFGGAERILDSVRRSLRQAIGQRGRVDLIHAYVSYPAGFIASVLSRETGIPYVLTEFMGPFPFKVHTTKLGCPRFEITEAINNSSKCIVLSEYLLRKFEEYSFKEPVIIPFSVDTDKFKPKQSEHTTIEVVSCSRLVVEKGVYDLIDGFTKALERVPNLRLTVIGEGPEKKQLQNLIMSENLSDVVHLTGGLTNIQVAEYFAKSDIFAMASHFDTFGVVFIEALSSGLPIVGTKCGGPDSFITPDLGILVPIKEVESFSEALVYVAENLKRYSKDRIRENAVNKYSNRFVAEQISREYSSVCLKN